MNENSYLEKCLDLIEKKLQWGNRKDWTSHHFNELRDRIEEKAKISISCQTLKRLFGHAKTSEKFNPQLATKNALAIYADFENWNDFVRYCLAEEDAVAINPTTAVAPAIPVTPAKVNMAPVVAEQPVPAVAHVFTTSVKPSPAPVLRYLIIGLAFVALAGSSYYAYSFLVPPSIVFQGKFLKGFAPLRASFYYDVSHVRTNDIRIETREKIFNMKKDEHSFSYLYEEPGCYNVRLTTGQGHSESFNVQVYSKDWVGVITTYEKGAIMGKELAKANGRMYVDRRQMERCEVDTTKEFWIDYRNIRNFEAEGDNFTFESTVRNGPSVGGISCYDFEMLVYCEKQTHLIRFVEPGCERWAKLILGEKTLDGNFSDLKAMGKSFPDWKKVKLSIQHKKVGIFYDGKLVYSTRYEQSSGKIIGLMLRFKGFGEVKDVQLYNDNNTLVYNDSFENVSNQAVAGR